MGLSGTAPEDTAAARRAEGSPSRGLAAPRPADLTAELADLGVPRGGTLLVHASMRRTHGVRVEAMLDALRRVLGPHGTVVVPAFTPENSDTSRAYRARARGLDPAQSAVLRAMMPAFDRATTPAPLMGALAETVRTAPGALRSAHPQTSFAALGPAAARLTAGHRQDCHLGEHSPLAALYAARARILLLGVGYEACTAFHLAEYRVPDPPRRVYRCVVGADGRRRWWAYEDVVLDDSDFGALGAAYEAAYGVRPPGGVAGPGGTACGVRTVAGGEAALRVGTVGGASCRLLDLRHAVDFAVRRLPVLRASRPAAQ